jgi:hypothetical protein
MKNPMFSAILLLLSFNAFAAPPTVSSFSPASAAAGVTVQITGTNFLTATAVSFGGIPATSFLVISATRIDAVVPVALSGQVQ